MSLWSRPAVYVRITHNPTGIVVEAIGGWRASLHNLKDRAMSVLRARVNARLNGIEEPTEVVASYTLPDDKPWPDDLTEFKRDLR